jgi:hypothetical protein
MERVLTVRTISISVMLGAKTKVVLAVRAPIVATTRSICVSRPLKVKVEELVISSPLIMRDRFRSASTLTQVPPTLVQPETLGPRNVNVLQSGVITRSKLSLPVRGAAEPGRAFIPATRRATHSKNKSLLVMSEAS